MDFRKQQNKSLYLENGFSNITIFKDNSFTFLYKKTEKISTAIYLVTNLMNTEEPLKWSLRKTSLGLLESVMSLSNKTMSSRDKCLRDISKKLFEIISLYSISFRSGFISDMNYRIVDNELNKLAEFVSKYDNEDRSHRENLFNEDYFNKGIEEIKQDDLIKDIKRNTFDSFEKDTTANNKDSIKDNKYKRQTKGQLNNNMSFKSSETQNVNSKSVDRVNRRKNIINIIKEKGIVSVKDISSVIKDTSEKTLQRELISMVEEEILLKEGERRWSRYSLK